MAGTFAELITQPTREIVVLAEFTPSIILEGWTKTSGRTSVYEIAFSPFVAADLFPGGIYRKLTVVRENAGTDYTPAASVSAVDAGASSYYLDAAAGRLYVQTSGGGSPDTYTSVQAFMTIFMASKPIVMNLTDGDPSTGVYYEPWLTGELPSVSQERPDMLFGITVASTGDVSLANGHGFFHRLVKTWVWKNKAVRFYIGGSYNGLALDYSQYVPLASMLIEDMSSNEVTCQFRLKPRQGLLEQTVPVTPFFESEYPNMGEGVRGTKKPVIYGRCTVKPALTDTTVGYGRYTVADDTYQTLFAVSAVRAVARANGAKTTVSGSDYSVDLTACTITVTNATYGTADYEIEADVIGKPDGAGGYMQTYGVIVKDMLMTFLGFGESDFDADAFTQIELDSPQELAVPLISPRSLASIMQTAEASLASIERSVMGILREGKDGKWTISRWSPSYDATSITRLTKADFKSFQPQPKLEDVFGKTQVYYGFNPATGEWSVEEASDPRVQYTMQTTDVLPVYTFLVNPSDALTLAQRYQFISGAGSTEVEFEERGALLARHIVGDKILVDYDPAPDPTGAYVGQAFELMRHTQSGFAPALGISGRLSDLQGIGATIGRWGAGDGVTWATATEEQRASLGFWSDASGFIDPADATTKNKKRWF